MSVIKKATKNPFARSPHNVRTLGEFAVNAYFQRPHAKIMDMKETMKKKIREISIETICLYDTINLKKVNLL
jgi:hypothetical protein